MFTFATAGTINFGRGVSDQLIGNVRNFGKRILLVTGANSDRHHGLVQAITEEAESVSKVACLSEPTVEELEAAIVIGRSDKVDCVFALGGGAAIDLAKAAAALITNRSVVSDYLEVIGKGQPISADPLPFVAIPTTAGTGAEVTKNAVITSRQHQRKVSIRDNRMFANAAYIDPALTDNTPVAITLACGLDAITQVIEPMISRRANPLTDAITTSAIERGLRAIKQLANEECASARDDMAYVSLSGGLALANSGLGVVHGIAGVLGGVTKQAHGIICGRLLVPALIENTAAIKRQTISTERTDSLAQKIGTAFGVGPDEAFVALNKWIRASALPRLDMKGVDIDFVALEAQRSSSMKGNPIELSAKQISNIIQSAL